MHGKVLGAGPATGAEEVDTMGPTKSLKIASVEQQVMAGALTREGRVSRGQRSRNRAPQDHGPLTGWETPSTPHKGQEGQRQRARGLLPAGKITWGHTLARMHR